MTANAGYHTYNTGDVLTAAQVQYNLQNQTVMYFATTTARDAALTGAILVEGLVSYVPSTKMMYYNGSAWVAVGAALPLTTTGDTLYSSPGATAVRLGIGTTGQVLTVAGGLPSWASAGSSGMTFISRTPFSNVASVAIDGCFTSSYFNYLVVVEGLSASTGSNSPQIQLRYSGTTQSASYIGASFIMPYTGATSIIQANQAAQFTVMNACGTTATDPPSSFSMWVGQIGNGSSNPRFSGTGVDMYSAQGVVFGGGQGVARAYDGILFKSSSTNITGNVTVYGLAKA